MIRFRFATPALLLAALSPTPSPAAQIHGGQLTLESFPDGSFALRSTALTSPILRANTEVELMTSTLRASSYPTHTTSIAPFQDQFGSGQILTITHTGPHLPELQTILRLESTGRFGTLELRLRNTTSAPLEVHALHPLRTLPSESALNLNGPPSQDRILSDSFSEDSPQLRILDLNAPKDGLHRGFGSQLILNRSSGLSLFFGALSADRLLTVLHLERQGSGPNSQVQSLDIASTGVNEPRRDELETGRTPANNVPLRLLVQPGETLSSEPIQFSLSTDSLAQLELYGNTIRLLHHARVSLPTPIGWWSWTAFYFGVNEGTILTNADWLAQNLASLGYTYFQIDEGYQYARGEYSTPDAHSFPNGIAPIGYAVTHQGLTFGLWVAPFEVSDRSWVYQHHPEWLVHTPSGDLVRAARVGGRYDDLFSLDTTHPGAQQYLRDTYRILVRDWNVRFLKMDFMDAAAVEGVYHRPNTTALEALRLGLQIIRQTVGDNVVLDKDGSPMLTPVGLVDTGRISQDTGHTFGSTRDAATGIAARFYMNRNFYISDPDAFTISEQTVPDRGWHGNTVPLTLPEAEASIALSAVSGGMFEIGDDLPTLGASPTRLALAQNPDLLDMARLGRASRPLDLMTYAPEDAQPSLFLLKQDPRQAILTVFNWTDQPRSHTLSLASLGLSSPTETATDLLHATSIPLANGQLTLNLPPHSVRMLKLIDPTHPRTPPRLTLDAPTTARTGDSIPFHTSATGDTPVLDNTWTFGDGITLHAAPNTTNVSHAYTRPGTYTVTLTATGLDHATWSRTTRVAVTGQIVTGYQPTEARRFSAPESPQIP